MGEAQVKFAFDGEELTIEQAQYTDGSLAVLALDEDGLPYATISVHMPGDKPPAGVFFLKSWSENEGIAGAFLLSGLIEPATGAQRRTSGYVTAYPFRFKEEDK